MVTNSGGFENLYSECRGYEINTNEINDMYDKFEEIKKGNLDIYSLFHINTSKRHFHCLPQTSLFTSNSHFQVYTKEEVDKLKGLTKEYEEKIKSLRAEKKLTSVDALSKANYILKLLGGAEDIVMDKEDYKNLIFLYEKMVEAYQLAAEKVPEKEWGIVASPSSFWEMRANQTRLKEKLS